MESVNNLALVLCLTVIHRFQLDAIAPRRLRRNLREFLRDLLAPFNELAGLFGKEKESSWICFLDVLNFRGFVVPGDFELGVTPCILARYCPVYEVFTDDTYSGVPSATRFPPCSPASGPKSIIQSAFLIRSK